MNKTHCDESVWVCAESRTDDADHPGRSARSEGGGGDSCFSSQEPRFLKLFTLTKQVKMCFLSRHRTRCEDKNIYERCVQSALTGNVKARGSTYNDCAGTSHVLHVWSEQLHWHRHEEVQDVAQWCRRSTVVLFLALISRITSDCPRLTEQCERQRTHWSRQTSSAGASTAIVQHLPQGSLDGDEESDAGSDFQCTPGIWLCLYVGT